MRISALTKSLEKNQLDGYLITNLKNIYYFTGFMDIADATLNLIVPLDGTPILLTPPLSYMAAREKAEGCVVEEVPSGRKTVTTLIKEIRDLKIKAVGFDDLPISTYLTIGKELELTKLVQNQSIVWELRRVKDDKEISFMRRAAELTDVGAKVGMEVVGVDVREYEVAAEIEYAMRRMGSEGVAFETVVASGPRSTYPHGVSTDRIIKDGDLVVLDLGAVYSGYRCDITRTVVVGNPLPRQARIIKLLIKAEEEAFKAIREGVRARDVDVVARKIVEDGGFGRHFIHGLGHGVGLDIHEPPRLSSESEDVLEGGNVVTDEPGIYVPCFGARIEDTVLVHRNCGEKLTKTGYFEY